MYKKAIRGNDSMLFRKKIELIKEGRCPFCSKEIDIQTEFKDRLSKVEYRISGLCQDCQDGFFR